MWEADGEGARRAEDPRMPYADLTEFAENPEVEKIGDLYTVDMLVQYVQSKLSA